MRKPDSFMASEQPTWCPGCGDFAVLGALGEAAANLGLQPHEMVLVSGMGCGGKLPQHFVAYGIHTQHGRALPTATGVKIANRGLTVVATGGDADGFGIGVGHFIHTCRQNVNVTYIVMDNQIGALTAGQISLAGDPGMVAATHPEGPFDPPVRPLELAIISGATFVAQGFAGDQAGLARIIAEAIAHPGFALVNVFSPCVTFNQQKSYEAIQAALTAVDADPQYDPTDYLGALRRIRESNSMVTGVLYRTRRPTFEERLPSLPAEPLTKAKLFLGREQMDRMMDEFR